MEPVELTSAQKAQYEQDGYTILKGLFEPDECDRFVDHMMVGFHYGRLPIMVISPPKPPSIILAANS